MLESPDRRQHRDLQPHQSATDRRGLFNPCQLRPGGGGADDRARGRDRHRVACLKAVGTPKALGGHYEVWDKKITREMVEQFSGRNPRAFRSFEARGPEDRPKTGQI